MFNKAIDFVKTNKDLVIKQGTVVACAVVGVIIAAIIVKKAAQDETESIVETVVVAE